MSISTAFGILFLAFVGIKIICWVNKLVRKLLDVSESVQNTDFADKRTLTTVNIPEDAHDAVEAFARLTHSTYSMIEQMSPGRDKYFYQIVIELKFGEDDASSQADFNFDFDYNMDGFHEDFGYKLGTGFSVENDYVYYRSSNIRNLYSWIGAATLQHKESGLPFDKYLADECANGIVATVVNNCPDAYVSSKSASEDGFYLVFKFR